MEIFGNYDVVIVGGGISGCGAAIASARTGAKTILIERFGVIGGMLNVSGPPGWAYSHLWNERGEEIIAGIVKETHHRLEKDGHALPYPAPEDRNFVGAYAFVDPDWWGLLMFEMMAENNVELLLHSLAVDVIKDGDKVTGVIVENPNGRMAVMGKVIIEATGEGDIAVRAGVPYSKIDRTKEEIDPPSITFHMDGVDWAKVTRYYKENPDEYLDSAPRADAPSPRQQALRAKRIADLKNCTCITEMVKAGKLGFVHFPTITMKALEAGDFHPYGDLGFFFTPREHGHIQPIFQHSGQVPDCDCNDVRELSAGETEARRQVTIALKAAVKYLPGFEKAYLTRVTTCVRTREGRHMVGEYQLTSDDVAEARKFPDVIAKCGMPTSTGGPFHSTAKAGQSLNTERARYASPKDDGSFDIPYRTLVPKDVENMLMCGKLMSCTEDFKRDLLPENMVTGQAAGVAAALCAKKGVSPRELAKDGKELQDILLKQGAILTGTL